MEIISQLTLNSIIAGGLHADPAPYPHLRDAHNARPYDSPQQDYLRKGDKGDKRRRRGREDCRHRYRQNNRPCLFYRLRDSRVRGDTRWVRHGHTAHDGHGAPFKRRYSFHHRRGGEYLRRGAGVVSPGVCRKLRHLEGARGMEGGDSVFSSYPFPPREAGGDNEEMIFQRDIKKWNT